MPDYDVRERHAIVIRAPAAAVYAALWSADLAPPFTRFLAVLRAIPGAVTGALRGRRQSWQILRTRMVAPTTMRDVLSAGFTLLAEDPPREVVLGLEGAFWRATGGVRRTDDASFRAPQPPGTARAVMNFHVEPRGEAACRLSTETRVRCADAASRRRFRLYWLIVRPGSGLTRRLALRSVRRAAEGGFALTRRNSFRI